MKHETDILNKAGLKLEQATGLKFSINEYCDDEYSDAVIMISWQADNWFFDTEIKKVLNKAVIGQIKMNRPEHSNPLLLVTDYVTPDLAEFLRLQKMNFIDAAGNAFISAPPLFINLSGNKRERVSETINRMYRFTGLKILFTLLSNPQLENEDYRTIASNAGAALGSVNWIMSDLKRCGYLIELGKKGRKLIKKNELIQNWVSWFSSQLEPKLIIGRYSSMDAEWLKKNDSDGNALFGSEQAANILTGYLKPEEYVIYLDDVSKNDFLIKNRLHRTTTGNIEIRKKFWFFTDQWTNRTIVPPLLIYADLIVSQSDRNIETAKQIYDNEIFRLIRQD